METKIMTLKEAMKIEANGSKAILNELMYSAYKANRSYGMSHADAVKLGLGNTESLLRYNQETKTTNQF